MGEINDEEEDSRLQRDWTLVTMIREMIGVAKGMLPTYFKAITFSSQILPEYINGSSKIVQRDHKPELVKMYIQNAALATARLGKEVTPMELISTDIAEYENNLAYGENLDVNLVKKELEKLKAVRQLFKPKAL